MDLIIQCVNGHKMTVAQAHVGKRVRCPQCQEVLTVQAPAAAPGTLPAPPPPTVPEDVARYVRTPAAPPAPSAPGRAQDRDYDQPRERPRRSEWDDRDREFDRRDDRDYDRDGLDHGLSADEVGQLQTVSVGLIFVGWRYLLWIFLYLISVSILTMALVVEEFARLRGRDAEPLQIMMVILGVISALILLVLLIFTFIGSAMCCRTPQRSGAKGLITGSLICDGIMIFSILMFVMLAIIAGNMRGSGEGLAVLAVAVLVIAALCLIAGQILLHLFLSRMGHFAHDPRLASSALSNMVLWLIFFLGGTLIGIAILIILAASRARSETAASVMLAVSWVNALLMILVYSLLLGVISRLRRRIASEIQGNMR